VELPSALLPELHGIPRGLGVDRLLVHHGVLHERLGRGKLALLLEERFDRKSPFPLGLSHGSPRYRDAPVVAPRDLRRATPVLMAPSETAAATAGTPRLSNIDGVMYSSPSSSFVTISASACAAARFLASFPRRARPSSMPRKNPGKQHELLIWFG